MHLVFYTILWLWSMAAMGEEVRKLPAGGAADLLNVTKFTPDGLPQEGARVRVKAESKCQSDTDSKDCVGTSDQSEK